MASGSAEEPSDMSASQTADRVRLLYPTVDESYTPLPRQWNTKDKSNILGLSQNNLVVHYKGTSKNHKDAASIRTTHPIPAACGVYYFEVKIVSKGRDGYMGIGLSSNKVSTSRLPGWDKGSYGYHGDDGNSFCSSGPAQPYGPTFSTGDVVGCCLNLIDNTCFYTKNGVNLGIAFRDLPSRLYPTVGLQTPGEIVEANFGQNPFLFDISSYTEECRQKMRSSVENFNVPNRTGEWQLTMQKIVSTYLVHHGYCATAEAFLHDTGQSCQEELASVENRQKIQGLVLAGRLGEAIAMTQRLYPQLLDKNLELLFLLRCRQFIELINGTDGETIPTDCSLPHLRRCTVRSSHRAARCPSYASPSSQRSRDASSSSSSVCVMSPQSTNGAPLNLSSSAGAKSSVAAVNGETYLVSEARTIIEHDTDMDTSDNDERLPVTNGCSSQTCVNGSSGLRENGEPTIVVDSDSDDDDVDDDNDDDDEDEDGLDYAMDVDMRQSVASAPTETSVAAACSSRLGVQLCGGSESAIRQLLQFGRYLHQLSLRLTAHPGTHRRMLRDVFSLLAYSDPWSSPVGYQLSDVEREPVCMALNSAILELQGLPRQPPLELAIAHARQCIRHMSMANVASCAFANISDYLEVR